MKSGSESSRLYATEYMVVHLRAKTQEFALWALRPLLGQLEDNSYAVRSAALNLLDEACDNAVSSRKTVNLNEKHYEQTQL